MTNNIYAVGRSMGSAPFYAYDISASSTFLHKVSVLYGIFYDKITQSRAMNMKEGIGTCGLKIAKEITLNPIEIGNPLMACL